MTDDDTGTDAGRSDDDRRDREQTLDTRMPRLEGKRLQGRLDQRLADAFEQHEAEVEQDTSRFNRATQDGWPIHYAVATSGAHGWQIEDDDGTLRLAEGAYPEDVSWLVFKNGWIHSTGARWLRHDDLVEWVAGIQDRREDYRERIDKARHEVFAADDRLQYETHLGGGEMPGWWVFEPTNYVGRPEAVVAYAAGYDACQRENE